MAEINQGSSVNFDGKVVLITGAGRGTGREIALAFGAQGANIAANDITPINLDETIHKIIEAGGRAKDFIADISKKIQVQSMVTEILEQWDRIDILINNAGVEPHVSLLEMDAWDWQRTLDVNLSGAFYTTQVVARVMREQGGGAIVNIASIAGGAHGLKDRAAYIASKMGLIGFTREAARELAQFNIRINAVCPGLIATELAFDLTKNYTKVAEWLENIPQNLLDQPQDVAGLVLFLCSSAASDISGQAINFGGGKVKN
jgi:NAD(P)-dependent dehydrogenase (short-subunit alcohol dehydrogenase family)